MLKRLAQWSYGRRRLVVVLWVLVLFGMQAGSGVWKADFNANFNTPGSESQRVAELLEEKFPERAGDPIFIVWTAEAGATSPAVQQRLEEVFAFARTIDHVVDVTTPFTPAGARFVAPGRDIAFGIVQLDVTADKMPLEETRKLIDRAAQASGGGLRIELAGNPVSDAQAEEASPEGIGLLVAAVILLISFGSFLAMGLPIVMALLGLGIATGIMAAYPRLVEVPDFAVPVAVMVGLGVGIDYVLFIVTRYRNALADGLEPFDATVTAITTAGRAVLFAGSTVIVSLLGMFLMGLTYVQGVALASITAVLIMMLASVTLLPAVLGFTGRAIDRFKLPGFGRKERVGRESLWFRWSRIVQRRPWPILLVGLALLIGLALPARDIRFGFPDAGNDSPKQTTRRAYDLLTQGFGPGFNGPLVLAVALPEQAGRAVAERIANGLRGVEGVATVTAPQLNRAGDTAVINIIPETSPQSKGTTTLIDRLRGSEVPKLVEGTGATAGLTGFTAAFVDQSETIRRRLPVFIGAVVALSFLLLLLIFRSLLVSLKAAIMNMLSIGAAYGVVAVAVQGGWFGGLFGIEEATPVPSFIPMMMFAILFGLSMDYEVFLLSRVREEYIRSGDNGLAVADGLATTARVITAAAAIMISVFLAFVFGELFFLKIMGLGLATAILVDATVVRMVLVPATMELLGDRNWWIPRWLDRMLPEVHIEGPAPSERLEPVVGT